MLNRPICNEKEISIPHVLHETYFIPCTHSKKAHFALHNQIFQYFCLSWSLSNYCKSLEKI